MAYDYHSEAFGPKFLTSFFYLLKNWKKLKASQGFLAGFCIQIANIIYTDIYPYVEGVFIFTEDQLLV